MGKVPPRFAVVLSNGLDCPHCNARLEVSDGSRMFATALGLAVAWLVWHFTSGGPGILDLVLPELYAIIAYGLASALTLMFIADLRLAPAAPAIDAAPAASHGHGGAHH
jgi:hypothetical protein